MAEPLYTQIRDDLVAKIEDGTYPPGTTIPSELELAESYGVSRPTVRQALQLLSEDGVVDRRRRRGTVVVDRRSDRHFVDQIEDFEGQLPLVEETAGHMSNKVLALRRELPPPSVAQEMGLNPEAEAYLLMRLRSVDDVPQVIATSYTPVDLFPDFMEHDFEVESFYRYLACAGHPIDHVERKISVTMPELTTATLLEISRETPCFVFDSVGRTRSERVVDYSHVLYRGDTNHFTVKLKTGGD